MNRWDEIWKNRVAEIENTDDIFEMFCKLKKADGFDTQEVEGYYEAFFEQWKKMQRRIFKLCDGKVESVYEVGCGSGVNLYLFQQLKGIQKLGGLDYSEPLVRLAGNVLNVQDLKCEEALWVGTDSKYDVVLADSVFQYFPYEDYGKRVLEKMWEKAGKMVVITEVHDQDKREEHMNYRRQCVQNYDEKYAGLDKTFYPKEMFEQFAEQVDANCVIVEPDNDLYWNNQFVFDCYLYR